MDELDSGQIGSLSSWVRGFTSLETPRLIARPLRADDDVALYDALKNPRVHTMIAGFEYPFTLSSVRRWLAIRMARAETGEGMYAAILHRGSGVLMGHFGTKIDVAAGGMEVGLAMNELYWGKGFVEELCFALGADLFAAGSPALVATCALDNWSSMRVLRAMTFQQVGTRAIETPQGERPSLLFCLTPDDFRRLKLMPLNDGASPEDIQKRRKELLAYCQELKTSRDVMRHG